MMNGYGFELGEVDSEDYDVFLDYNSDVNDWCTGVRYIGYQFKSSFRVTGLNKRGSRVSDRNWYSRNRGYLVVRFIKHITMRKSITVLKLCLMFYEVTCQKDYS